MGETIENSKDSIARLLNHLIGEKFLHRRTLGVILGLTHIAKKGKELVETVRQMVECLSLELGFENISILKYDPERECLKLIAAKGVLDYLELEGQREFNKRLCIAPQDSIAWQVFSSKEPIFIEDTTVQAIPRLQEASITIRSLACLPLGEVGVLNLSTSCPRSFGLTQKRDLIIIAELIANLIETLEFRGRAEISNAYIQRVIEAKTRELAQSKQELKEALELFDSMIHGVPQGLALLDLEGKIYSVNDALCALAKATHRDLLQLSFDALLQRRSDIDAIGRAIKEGKMAQVTAGILRSVKGDFIPVDIFYHPFSLKGHGIGGMLIFHDLRGQRQRLEEMVKLEKMKALSLMAKGIAHDFNNILSMILGNIEILDSEIEDQEHKARLAKMLEAVIEGARIVDHLNIYVGQGGERVKGTTKDLPLIVEQAVGFLGPRLKELRERQGMEIDIDLSVDDEGVVLIDPGELKEILVNVLLNAVEAMPEGGTIKITSKRSQDQVRIEIEDTGIGIPEEDRDKIFDPFYTTKGVKASGLGLCVSKGLLQNYGGTISFDSEEGRGTRFIITLPIQERKGALTQDLPEEPQEKSSTNVPRLKILVVDDEFIIVELLSTLLSGLGHDVQGVADPQKAREILARETFDLVITDLGMPGMSGFDLASIVKRHSPHTKVVLITGWGAEYKRQDLNERGVDGVLGKPFKLDELRKLVEKMFRQ